LGAKQNSGSTAYQLARSVLSRQSRTKFYGRIHTERGERHVAGYESRI